MTKKLEMEALILLLKKGAIEIMKYFTLNVNCIEIKQALK